MRIRTHLQGRWTRTLAGLAIAASLLSGAGMAAAAVALTDAQHALAARVQSSADAGGRPWAIVDKQAARMVVFHADGTPAGSTPVLLGRTRGDHSVPGVGARTQAGRLLPGDATTPAGRHASTPGFNHTGEAVVWVDPDTAFAIHRVRPDRSQAARLRALEDGRAAGGRRLSAGCVVVPVAFYETVVQPLLGRRRGVVYVLPENGAWQGLAAEIDRRALDSGL
jgi:hypothetical protein